LARPNDDLNTPPACRTAILHEFQIRNHCIRSASELHRPLPTRSAFVYSGARNVVRNAPTIDVLPCRARRAFAATLFDIHDGFRTLGKTPQM
jgi:hypothetical protein